MDRIIFKILTETQVHQDTDIYGPGKTVSWEYNRQPY